MRSKWTITVQAGLVAIMLATGARAKTGNTKVVCRLEVDRAVLPANSSERAVIKVTLDPPRAKAGDRPPVNLAIVLDRSGSMSGQKIERAKEAAIEAIRRLGRGDICSVIIYNHEVQTLVPAQSAGNLESIEQRIRSIKADGNTALFGGVSQGAAEVRKNLNETYIPRILLLSDGLANVGPSSPDDLGRLGSALIKEDISVSTIGVGTDYNEDLMTRLSQRSDGNAYFAESGADLARIFQAELGDVLSVVAREVVLEIDCPKGVRPIRIIGRDGRIDGGRVELRLNQLYGGQQKYALIEVDVPATAAETDLRLADAQCRYRDALDQSDQMAEGSVSVRFSLRKEDVEESANVKVQRDVVLNYTAMAKDQAVELNDAGKRKEAAEALRRQSEDLRELGEKYEMDDLVEESKKIEATAGRIEKQGMSSKGRKDFRTDSYQTRNQQLGQ